jgi:dienelactone hydrolase
MKSLALLPLCGLIVLAPLVAHAASPHHCLVGAYRMADGSSLDLAPSRGDTLRWTRFSGETGRLTPQADGSWRGSIGWTDRPAAETLSAADCETGEITFAGLQGRRLAFDITETSFDAGDVKLAGRLVLPKGAGRVPIVVIVQGSEADSAREVVGMQRSFPAEGIGAFVYDKRGTGGSGGAYTQDMALLADDAVMAMKEARRLAGDRAGRVGYQGGSQGGWVVPLAANRAPVDFAIVSFGLTVSMLEQDRQAVLSDMRQNGHSAQDTEKALALDRAGQRVLESRGKDGYEAFDALRREYRAEPWFKDVRGNLLHLVLPLDRRQLDEALATKYNFAVSFRYDPMPTLRTSTTPQLWVLAADDVVAPSAGSAADIRALMAEGKPYALAVYPRTGHGMVQFELGPDGKRVSIRLPEGYFPMMRDFIRDGRIATRYGDASVAPFPGTK